MAIRARRAPRQRGKKEEIVRVLTRGREAAIHDLCSRLVSSGIPPHSELPAQERSVVVNTTRSWQQLWNCPLRWGIGPALIEELITVYGTDGKAAVRALVPETVDPKVRDIVIGWLRDHGFVE